MDRILVFAPAEDQRGRAVWLAAALARRTGASLTLIRVLEESLAWPRGPQSASHDKLRTLMIEAESRDLERIAEELRAAIPEGLEIETEVHWGVPWEVVIGLVEQRDFDLVIKPARGLSHSGRVFFGATALHLFRRCPCPVWVVGDDGHLPKRILLAIDPENDVIRRRVASRVLAWGDAIRDASGADLEIASAWVAPGADALKSQLDSEELDRYVLEARTRAEHNLETILTESSAATGAKRVNLLAGAARDIIPAFVEDREFDLVVVGTLGREGVVGEILGETAELILRGVRCSVIAISPRHRMPGKRSN
jgi:nucleotide-binding universal stress UspA family protein